jgi:hypothetical protein
MVLRCVRGCNKAGRAVLRSEIPRFFLLRREALLLLSRRLEEVKVQLRD